MADISVELTDYSTSYVRDTSNDGRDSIVSTDTFLKLLVAQLKYQDPLAPQDNTQFVTQLAQMTSLQEMQNMSAALDNSQAYDMIGKEVYAVVIDTETNQALEYFGVVDSVVIREGVPYIVIGNTMISLSDVVQIFNPLPEEEDTETEDTETEDTETPTE